MEQIKNFLLSMFSEDKSISMMRITSFMVCINVMAVWTWECLTDKFTDIGLNNALLVAAAIGGKALQSFADNKK